MLTVALVIGLSSNDPGAASGRTLSATSPSAGLGSPRAAPVHILGANRSARPQGCLSARKAVAYYRAHTHHRQSARGGDLADRTPMVSGKSCHWARYAATVWVDRAKAALKALKRWEHDWAWWKWLPQPYRAIFQCETPTANHGINWRHNSGTYQGGPGFYWGTWDGYKPAGFPSEAYDATPREQFIVAQRVANAVGFGAWGCYSHGGYRSHL